MSPAALSILEEAWLKQLSTPAMETSTDSPPAKSAFSACVECMDTTIRGGKLILHVFGALAEFERELIRERIQAGLRSARARGRNGSRPAKMDAPKISMARALMENPNASITDVCDTLRISGATQYRHLEKVAGK